MRVFILAVVLVASLVQPVLALQPERREVVVTSNRVWDGYVYQENFVPSSMSDMALLADKDNAISFVRTEEYYWPLSRQTYVDFDRRKDPVAGTLQISQSGKIVSQVDVAPYVMVYPHGAAKGEGYLVWGEDADREYATYQEDERNFAIRFSESQRAQSDYQRRLKEAAIARLAGKGVQAVEPPPPPPEPSLRLVTRPVAGLRVNLPAGTYEIQLVDKGQPVPGTQKTLHVITADGQDVVTADIIPEERWTRPLSANDPAEKIYARPGTTFYLTLAYASQYDEAAYLSIVQPQATPVDGRKTWVRRRSADAKVVSFGWTPDGAPESLDLTALKVQQTKGSGFGYVVRPAKPTEQPDLAAFALTIPGETDLSRGHFSAKDTNGASLSREVIVVQPRADILAWGLALMPIGCGFGLMVYRRRSTGQT